MLPIYTDISFLEIIEKGGRTRPWVLQVDTGTTITKYVVKLFSDKEIETNHAVASEVFGNILAKEFDLSVPNAALFEFENNFIHSLPEEPRRILDQKHPGIKFGTELIEGALAFTPSLHKYQIRKIIEIDSLFGFDHLILNPDRNNHKPNILLTSKSAFVIDHEFAFSMNNSDKIESINSLQPLTRYQWHIFYNYLKKSQSLTKDSLFNSFFENLRLLNINCLNTYAEQLIEHQQPVGEYQRLHNYLRFVKLNPEKFVRLLQSLIR